MKRRTLLSSVTAGAAAALAGCLDTGVGPGGDGNDGGSGDGDDGGSGGDGTTTTSSTPSVADSSLSVTSAECGTGTNEASVDASGVGSSGGTVTVTGTIMGNDQCYTAKLKAASYDAGADALTVNVVSYVPEEEKDSACGQCIVDIAYEASVEVSGGTPGTVVVRHGDETVAEVSTGGGG